MTSEDVASLRAALLANREVLERLEAQLAAAVAAPAEAPLSSWKEVAAAIGVSEDTLKRRRNERADKTPPTFGTAAEARRWYRQLVAGEEPARRTSRRPATRATPSKGTTLADIKAGKRR